MRTFCEFVEQRDKVSNIFESIVFEAKQNEELYKILAEAGFWGGVGNALNAGWNAITGAGRDIGQRAVGAWSQVTGPLTQYGNAIASLKKASQQIANDETLKQSTTTGTANFPAKLLTQWLPELIAELESQQGQIKNKSVTPAQASYGAPSQPGTFTNNAGQPFQQQVSTNPQGRNP